MLFLTYLFLIILSIILAYLIYKIISLFLNYRKDIQNREHYPIVLGLTLASIPIIAKLTSIDLILISFFNTYTALSLPLPNNDLFSIFFYFIFVSLIAFLGYFTLKNITEKNNILKSNIDNKKIDFPEEPPSLSPNLYERIKELFELKYEKMDLKLTYDEKEQVLYGTYSEQFHKYQFFIYCEDSTRNISKDEQSTILSKLEILALNVKDEDYEYEKLFFYFIKEGIFELNKTDNLKCFTETDFIDNIIDFRKYLQNNISIFNNEIDIGGKSLNDTFIIPNYNSGQNDLKRYLDNWLTESSDKHIALLADYGMGKTSFLRYYTKYLSDKILNGEKPIRYPIFISLTNTSPMSNDGIETKIESFVAKELGINYALFERLVHLGKIVFILDGFDEMGFIGTENTRYEQFNSIWKLATKNNKILISGRPSYLPTTFERTNILNVIDENLHDALITPYTEIIHLDYFDSKKIFQTVNMYYDKKDSKKYIDYIKKNQSIFDLCKRPSMLHMTMHILPTIYQENPSDKVTSSLIMTKYIEYWISRQDKKKIFGVYSQSDNRKKEFIMSFFIELSFFMFNNKTLLIEKNELDKLIIEKIKNEKLEIENNQYELDGFLNEICTGYFIEVDITNENSFKFVHKSIFEFFISRKIIQLIEKSDFSNEVFTLDWGVEISDFVQDSIEKNSEQGYPALITLRNSFWDKYLFIPMTKLISAKRIIVVLLISYFILLSIMIYSKSNTSVPKENIQLNLNLIIPLMVAIFLNFVLRWKRKRMKFISRAYYIDFISNHNKMSNSQFQYFLDFHTAFDYISNMKIQNFLFKKLYIKKLFLTNVEVEEVNFEKCSLRLYFNNALLTNINFTESSIKYLFFENVSLFNVTFRKCIFHKLDKYDYFEAKFLDKFLYIMSLNFLLNDSINFKNRLRKVRSKIFLENVKMDEYTLKEFQNFIIENDLRRRDIFCDDVDLKNKLFQSNMDVSNED